MFSFILVTKNIIEDTLSKSSPFIEITIDTFPAAEIGKERF